MNERVVTIIQGRMASSRLPGKILADIAGKPMLRRVFDRAARARRVTRTVFATTSNASDDGVRSHCENHGIPCYRGDPFDVLDRYYRVASQEEAGIVVRITADCPVIDPAHVDAVTDLVATGGYDFACNRLPRPWRRTFPIGLDVEACTFAALKQAWTAARDPRQREHVMPYIYEGVALAPTDQALEAGTSASGQRIALMHHDVDYGTYRWTVDTAEDLEFVRQVYSRFGGRDDFGWLEVLALVHAEPALARLNATVRHNTLEDFDRRALK